jgi:hypothetical protein
MKQILIIFFNFLVIHSYAQNYNGEIINESQQSDNDCFINLITTLLDEDKCVSQFTSNLRNYKFRQRTDLGFGLQRSQYYQYGEHIVNYVTILVFKDTIIETSAEIAFHHMKYIDSVASKHPTIAKNINQYWVKGVTDKYGELGNYFLFHHRNKTEYAKMLKHFENELGVIDTLSVEENFKSAYNLLTNADELFAFGDFCYSSGTAPVGKTAIAQLEKYNKVEMIKNIVKSCNPEGRVYAIVSLLNLSLKGKYKLTSSDKALIKKIINSNIPISTCGGCTFSTYTAKEIFHNFDLMDLILRNQINL